MTSPRSRGMAVLTVIAALAVGVALGIGVERRVLHRRPDNRGGRGGGPFGMMSEPVDTATRNRMRGRIVKRLTDELGLTPTQAQSVDAIFARRELQLDSLRLRVNPQLDSLRDHMRLSIDSVLSAEQRVKFAEQRRRMDERRRTDAGPRRR